MDDGPYAKKGAPSIKKLLAKDSEELLRNKDGEDLHRGYSLRQGGEGWRARKFLKERRGRMAMNFLDSRKFLASRIFLELRMAIEELP